MWAAKQGCIFLRNTVTKSAISSIHKLLEALCFYGSKEERKKQGFGFIAECGGEEEERRRAAEQDSRRGDTSTCLTSVVQ